MRQTVMRPRERRSNNTRGDRERGRRKKKEGGEGENSLRGGGQTIRVGAEEVLAR
jgi:hypothetical protein